MNFWINIFRNVCSVQCGVFCSCLISCIAGMLLRYCVCHCEVVPVALLFNISLSQFLLYLPLRIISTTLLITFLSPEVAKFINTHVLFLLTRIMMSGLLLWLVGSVCTCWFHNLVTLPSRLVSTHLDTS